MKALWITLAVLAGGFFVIIGLGAMLPETEASRARQSCDTLERLAYSATEKAQAADTCAMLRKEADRRMGRLPAGAQ